LVPVAAVSDALSADSVPPHPDALRFEPRAHADAPCVAP
jgi:hypothetical protein